MLYSFRLSGSMEAVAEVVGLSCVESKTRASLNLRLHLSAKWVDFTCL